MKKGDFIFVYGTLRRGERADLSKKQGHFGVIYIGEDDVNGKLYHLGGFPGLKTEAGEFDPDKPVVHGEVFLVTNTSIMAVLDAYEGYPELYTRFQTGTRRGKAVWVYVYPHPVRQEQLIQSGDWVKNREMLIPHRSF